MHNYIREYAPEQTEYNVYILTRFYVFTTRGVTFPEQCVVPG